MSMPSVFGLPHLSEDAVAAFADGVLSPAATARAERHCAECAECADAVRGQRETAMMLRSAVAPPLPSGLLDRLAGLPMSAPLPPTSHGLPTALGPDGTAMYVAHDPSGRLAARQERHDEQNGRGGGQAHSRSPHRSGHSEDESGSDGHHRPGAASFAAHPFLRRGALPVGLIAAAGAVVAAGALGSHTSTVYGPTGRTGPAANVVGVVNPGTVTLPSFSRGATPAPRAHRIP
ncbi:hypothetical protein M6D93_15440 [Jatrophihabitans telluris]|uniref:Zinc-finger domain-containing protein n=1 Tax=Jatrophihabitans telluris TaxID=2038343 RepID=A0ABY4QXQ4_9ACTN|nr:hypothetical protein [Jatrophihabitans telluris]UQX87684.1 hypothetical protein M6D93_15440 [Jatrophihabitans telluris]